MILKYGFIFLTSLMLAKVNKNQMLSTTIVINTINPVYQAV
ncbi:hypothetical protein MmmBen181_0796 [Mycoplasma mycoides subsp. mycoides]|nr:hypothetical protein MmmBen_0746 [Mycoplasma mycoides subsp. mycoides]AME11900.1 hypothetical protein MmmBen50_0728 [Mycoplasma mycoides subsp. mycoides]AME12936.1 hypothetical protein MmmBen181_0796 [Mycoplasma mycoides subsp. mycoides]AME13960.1 hypothetical protein MmmBen326_0754 [Mycoplasma mycoides subsp. mycoides]AME14920.1 hypothetical protein MmmBen468_0710 [Mycoplasma mycoides subsp. mycoides]